MPTDPYRDASLGIDARIEDLLDRMTLDEKLAQLGAAWASSLVGSGGFSEEKAAAVIGDGIGHVTRVSGELALPPERTAALANAVQSYLVERTRLGIPAIVHEESTAGLCARDATQFPQAIGLAATWDPALVEELAGVIREQMLAVGARQTLAPVLDIARDPRWGRVEETYGEDPYLASRMGVGYVRGLQTRDLARGVACTAKHFLGYGLPEGGMNHAPVQLGPREVREVFAAPFRAAINEASLAAVMNSYSAVDGLPCGGSAAILDDLLRRELGFTGQVVADYWTVDLLVSHHAVATDRADAARRALRAGIDVELPARACYRELRDPVERGEVPVTLVDRGVRRVLAAKFALGLFEDPHVDEHAAAAAFDTGVHRALARRVAQRSIVLLKNDGLLPLSPDSLSSVAVIGPCADDGRLLLGDYHYPAHVEIVFARREGGRLPTAGGGFPAEPGSVPIVTVLEGVRAAVAGGTSVRHARGCDVRDPSTDGIAEAVEAALACEVAVVAVGGRSGLMPECTSGEMRDTTDLGLTGAQPRLVEAIVATGTPTVVVLVNGRVLALPWVAEHAAAVVEAWLPGEEGGAAVADVLFGVVSPAGRLPVSIPRAAGQVPAHYDHRSGGGRSTPYGDYVDGPSAPLYAFGHGLSYTTFEYADLAVSPEAPTTGDPLVVECTITNTGGVTADEVVQLYVRDEIASTTRPVKQLAGFARVHLEPGGSCRVRFELDPGRLGLYDEAMRYVVEPGAARVMVGAASDDIRLRRTVHVAGAVREVDPNAVAPTAVVVR